MRNFNNEDIDKYEKLTKNAVEKFKRKVNINAKIPSIKLSQIAWLLLTSGLTYYGYRAYEFKKSYQQRYIDLFQWKSSISSKVQRLDLAEKISNWDMSNQMAATQRYQKQLRQQFGEVVSKIKENSSYKGWQRIRRIEEYQKQGNQKKEDRDKVRELVLTKTGKSKLDLGQWFKLHTKQYITTISNNGEINKKTFIIPVTLFNLPISVTKKQQTKKIGRRAKFSQLLGAKAKPDLSSECEKINYWNFLLSSNAKPKTQKNIKSEGNESQPSQKEEVVVSSPPQLTQQNGLKSRQEVLYECRKRVKLIEQALIDQLKETIDEYWSKERKEDQ